MNWIIEAWTVGRCDRNALHEATILLTIFVVALLVVFAYVAILRARR